MFSLSSKGIVQLEWMMLSHSRVQNIFSTLLRTAGTEGKKQFSSYSSRAASNEYWQLQSHPIFSVAANYWECCRRLVELAFLTQAIWVFQTIAIR